MLVVGLQLDGSREVVESDVVHSGKRLTQSSIIFYCSSIEVPIPNTLHASLYKYCGSPNASTSFGLFMTVVVNLR
jgi:hypothetical protein